MTDVDVTELKEDIKEIKKDIKEMNDKLTQHSVAIAVLKSKDVWENDN